MTPLYNPQEAHVRRLLGVLDKQNSVADMSKCAMGKTLCAAEVARLTKQPPFVVAPISTIPAWRRELADRGVEPVDVMGYEKLRTGKTKWLAKAGAFWKWNLPKGALIVFDESQRLKSPNSLTSKLAIAAKPYTTMLLSGSMAESPLHMRAAGWLLGLHGLRDYWRWALAHGCTPGMFGGLEFTGGPDALDKLHREIIPNRGSKINFADMKPYLPANQVLFEEVTFGDDGKIAKLYTDMEEELLRLGEAAETDSKGAQIMTEQLRARQEAELLKVPLLAERAQDAADEGNKVIVFLCFTASLLALSERVGGIPIISGKHGDREAVIQDFQADRTPILGVNVAAGGVGVNLQGAAPRRTFISPSFNPIDVIQALGRAPRPGGGDTIQFVLSAAGTIEAYVACSLQQKLEHIDIISNGSLERRKLEEKLNQIAAASVD